MDLSNNDKHIKHTLSVFDGDEDGRDDWHRCGIDIYQNLSTCYSHLKKDDLASVSQDLRSVLDRSHRSIQQVHHSNVERKWRRVYTDTAIFIGVFALKQCKGVETPEEQDAITIRDATICDAIRALDIAIVQCGAPGYERLELIQGIIKSLQKNLSAPLLSDHDIASLQTGEKTQAEEEPDFMQDVFCLASVQINELLSLPSLDQYLKKHHQNPFVVRNYASNWPALKDKDHCWADCKYLEKVAGPARVVPVEIGQSYLDDDWTQSIVSWNDFLKASGWVVEVELAATHSDKVQYLAQHNLFRQFSDLEDDIEIPDIVYACPPPTIDFPEYRPPLDEDRIETCVKNAWIGPKGTTTPPHFDPYYNAYVQVVGQKLVWVAPPSLISNDKHCLIDSNTLDLAVFESKSDEIGKRRIKREALKVILSPGDLLVMPPGWFHAMQSLTRSFSVSMWF